MKKCDVLLICGDGNRGETVNGLPYSKLIDSIHEEISSFGFVCRQFASPGSKLIGRKAWGNPYSLNGWHCFFSFFNRYAWFLNTRIFSGQQVIVLKEIHLFRWLLFRTKPRMIIAIGPWIDWCKIAHEKKIPLIEPLHGLGYAVIPWGYDKRPKEELPTHIISFDKRSTFSFSPLRKVGVEILELKHLWYEKKRDVDQKGSSFIKGIYNSSRKSFPKTILVSLVWGYDGDHGDSTEFSGILTANGLLPEELIEIFKETRNEVLWLVRRHPVQMRSEKYKHQEVFLNELVCTCENVEWKQSTQVSLNMLLPEVQGHVTMSSMTTYEAALFGVKTLTLCPNILPGNHHATRFNDLEELGYVQKGTFNKEGIRKWVSNVKKARPKSLTDNPPQAWESFIKELI